ncbi:MAG: hypothetical protein ABFD89_03155 [Bryobacteraceae bacterium]
MPTGFLLFSLCVPATLLGQEGAATVSARYAASFTDYGQVHKFDGTLGYRFNEHIELSAGVPFYLVRSSVTLDETTSQSSSGIGNAYLNLNLAADTSLLRYWSVASVTAPTGDKSKGFSTGRVTFDWTHGIAKDIGRVTPFVSVGVANAITDSPFWIRPFSALGVNVHAEGGGLVRLGGPISVGASAYTIQPTGEQKVYSKVVHGQAGQGAGASNGQGGAAAAPGLNKRRVFETSAVSTGESSLTRDNGFSAWLTARLTQNVTFTAIYSRSRTYALDTFSVGFGLDIGSLIKTRRL